jgi:hypothetical protein
MLVMGSPLTMTTMVCARAGALHPIAASRIAAMRVERRSESMAVMFLSAFFNLFDPGRQTRHKFILAAGYY